MEVAGCFFFFVDFILLLDFEKLVFFPTVHSGSSRKGKLAWDIILKA